MDTTLRDGEQTSGVSLSVNEKLSIAKILIEELGVDRLEVASARVSEGEKDAVKAICKWAETKGFLDRIEVLGFIDNGVSLDWLEECGCKTINLLAKGSEKHCHFQLKKSSQEHFEQIKGVVADATKRGIKVNLYLEDWSNGIIYSPDYVMDMMNALKDEAISNFMLPDTLGILNPYNTEEYCKMMVEAYPDLNFDFHAHNDYDLAIANCMGAIRAGIDTIHATVNGLGERAGNAPLSSLIAVVHDQFRISTSLNETKINKVSRMVEMYTGMHIAANRPVIGENVFTQCAGIHADGDNKNNLYYNELLPERFGRVREYALGKTSGKANIKKNLDTLGIELDDVSMRKVTERIIELGDKKELVTAEDLPYIIADVLKNDMEEPNVKILNYSLSLSNGLHPTATLKIEIDGADYEEFASGDGQYDAFMRALRKIYVKQLSREFPILTNYSVTIPPGGRTDALVQTIISWKYKDKEFKTRGLDPDQTEAAIKATIKMLNAID